MTVLDAVRIGIIGLGNMGESHAKELFNNEINGGKLAAICDSRPERLKWARESFGDSVKLYDNLDAFFDCDCIDGVLVATPHYSHPELAMRAFDRGLHVLIEKPAGVYTKRVRLMNEAAAESGKVFGIMYNQRTILANTVLLRLRMMLLHLLNMRMGQQGYS